MHSKILLLLALCLPMFAQDLRVTTGSGAPLSGTCHLLRLGAVYIRTDGASAGQTFYVCEQVATGTFAWVGHGAGGGGGGSSSLAGLLDVSIGSPSTTFGNNGALILF